MADVDETDAGPTTLLTDGDEIVVRARSIKVTGEFFSAAAVEAFAQRLFGAAVIVFPEPPAPPRKKKAKGGVRPIHTIKPGGLAERILASIKAGVKADATVLGEDLGVPSKTIGLMLPRLRAGGHIR